MLAFPLRPFVACALLALAGCAPDGQPGELSVNDVPTPRVRAFDLMYFDAMLPHEVAAADLARAALARTLRPELRAFAEGILADTDASATQMALLEARWYPDVETVPSYQPVAVPAHMMDMRAELGAIAGVNPDLAYIDAMVRHQEGALELANAATGKAEHPELAALASAWATNATSQLATLRAWRASWFPNAPAPQIPVAVP